MPTAADFVNEASSYIGTPYVWGGDSPRGFDCSGLVQFTLERLGLRKVPRTSEKQYRWATPIDSAEVQAGDLVFMNFPGEASPGHVAIFAGKTGRGPTARSSVIQAPKPGGNVQQVPFTPLPAGSSEWGGRIVGYGRVPGLSYQTVTLEGLWLAAGGPPKVAKTMAAIALAESGGRVGAKGGPNADGSYDYGLWQINSSHGYNVGKLLGDAAYNARAAVAVYRSQGLSAWSTYTNGTYRKYLNEAGKAEPIGKPPRPGDSSSSGSATGGGGSSSGAGDAAAAAAWDAYGAELAAAPTPVGGGTVQPAAFNLGPLPLPFGIPGIGIPGVPSLGSWNPLKPFEEAGAAVSDLGTFLHWTAWLFSPRNILRIVEFVAGAGMMLVGARFALETGRGGGSSRSSSSSGPSGVTKATIRRAVRATPAGRAYAIARATGQGRRAARSARAAHQAAGQREEEKRARKTAQKRARQPGESRQAHKQRRKGGDVPF